MNNLPVQFTPLIGREQEVAAVCTLLRRESVRLVTLTGPGGVGKTRLSVQAATALLDDFGDGVCFVPLAPIGDPDLVVPTIAQTLGIKEGGGRPLLELLQASVGDKRLLLLLDNFEHLPADEALAQSTAVALFLERARAVRPDFQLTAASSRAIAEICVRLDGLPLLLELAAARINLLPPQALLARLSHRLQVLTSGGRDVPARQQTLRNTLAWSYELLAGEEQRLFRRLSVFAGGCTLGAVEGLYAALGELPEDLLNGVASLMDKSLLRQTEQEGEPRLLMLETIREYGLEALAAPFSHLPTPERAQISARRGSAHELVGLIGWRQTSRDK
jgi:predicted ATPase